jgi:hypothetical protein
MSKRDEIIEDLCSHIYAMKYPNYPRPQHETKDYGKAEIEAVLDYLKIDVAEDCEILTGVDTLLVDGVPCFQGIIETRYHMTKGQIKEADEVLLIHRPERNIISADIVGVKGE